MADTPTPTLHDRLVAMLTAGERLRRTAPVDDDFPEVMHQFDGAMRVAREALDAVGGVAPFDLVAHLHRQRAFSLKTFGPGERTAGVLDHIRKELAEVAADPGDVMEWIDLVILALDGAWRAGHQPVAIVDALVAKQTRNEGRTWPDWRTADPSMAIEHDRTGEESNPVEVMRALVVEAADEAGLEVDHASFDRAAAALVDAEDPAMVADHAAALATIPKPDAPAPECTGLHHGEEWRECSACNPPDVAIVNQAPPVPHVPGLSELHDRIAAVMQAWQGENGGIYAVNGCALEVARLVLTGTAGSVAFDACGHAVAAHYNLEDLARQRQAAEVERTERAAELSALRGTVERHRRALEEVAFAAGMFQGDLDDRMPEPEVVVERVRQLSRSRGRNEHQATEAMRMLWLVVRTAGAPDGVTIPLREVMAVDWSRCELQREDVLGTGDIRLRAVDTGRGPGSAVNLCETDADAARRLAGELVAVADALGLDEGADLPQLLAAIDGLKERAARVIDRRLEQAITSALGCDETPAAIVEAITALKHRAGQGGPSQHRAMHQQLLDMLGASDHQGAAARIGELAGLELLLHAGGAGKGVTAIAQERRGQIEREGYAPSEDDEYTGGELVQAAVAYALWGVSGAETDADRRAHLAVHWPGTWNPAAFKPRDDRANLVRAGALIAAELDRMDREEGRHA